MDLDILETPVKITGAGRQSPGTGEKVTGTDSKVGTGGTHGVLALPAPAAKFRTETPAEKIKHDAKCKDAECPRCRWHRQCKGIQRKLPMRLGKDSIPDRTALPADKAHLLQTSWRVAGFADDGKWGIGCVACSQLKADQGFSNFTACRHGLKLAYLRRHQQRPVHRRAVMALLGIGTGPTGRLIVGAPPAEEFSAVLTKLQQGRSIRDANSHGSTSTKTTRIMSSLTGAMWELDRKFLKSATTIVLCRDERDGRLLVRHGAANAALDTRRGVLGQVRHKGSNATCLVAATMLVLKSFCADENGKLDRGLLTHIRNHIEVVVTDSAENEILAGEVGRGTRTALLDDLESAAPSARAALRENLREKLTPNLLFIGRDCARGFRRTPPQRAASARII